MISDSELFYSHPQLAGILFPEPAAPPTIILTLVDSDMVNEYEEHQEWFAREEQLRGMSDDEREHEERALAHRAGRNSSKIGGRI